jgi:hypothetical protein
MMPFVAHVEYRVPVEKAGAWADYYRVVYSVYARMAGLMLARLLGDARDAGHYFSIGVWRTKEDRARAIASPASRLIAPLNPVAGDEDSSAETIELELVDHVWGREGPGAWFRDGMGWVTHLWTRVPVDRQAAWTPYRRNMASVLARQNGLVAMDCAVARDDPERFLFLRTWADEKSSLVMRSGERYAPSQEVVYATLPPKVYDLYAESPPTVFTDCTLVDAVFGPEGLADYAGFMRDLPAV